MGSRRPQKVGRCQSQLAAEVQIRDWERSLTKIQVEAQAVSMEKSLQTNDESRERVTKVFPNKKPAKIHRSAENLDRW